MGKEVKVREIGRFDKLWVGMLPVEPGTYTRFQRTGPWSAKLRDVGGGWGISLDLRVHPVFIEYEPRLPQAETPASNLATLNWKRLLARPSPLTPNKHYRDFPFCPSLSRLYPYQKS